MKTLRTLTMLTICALLLSLNLSCTDPSSASLSWYEGAAGYERAAQEWKQSHAPAFIYFHTDWCHFCREFERELLSKTEVKEYLQNVVKVRINPEAGRKDQEIAAMFGVAGYPAIFMLPSGATKAVPLARHKKVAGQWALMSPTEFVQACKSASQ